MKITVLLLCLKFSLCSFACFAQSTYYQNDSGAILDSLNYHQQKQKTESNAQKVNKKASLYEDLSLVKQNQDSIIFAYKWAVNLDGNLKTTAKDRASKKSLVDQPFPFELLDGDQALHLSDLQGKPTFITLWFTGCGICIEEFPQLNQLKEKFGDKVNFIAITFSKQKNVDKILAKYPLNYTHYTGVKALTKKLNISAYPTSLFLDRSGKVIKVTGGLSYEKDSSGKLKLQSTKGFEDEIAALL